MGDKDRKICVPQAHAPDCSSCRVGPVDKRTSELYETCNNFPLKFDCPGIFKGYGCEVSHQHPLYKTTSNEYGFYPPGNYSVSTSYFPAGQKFTQALLVAGMYKNYSLNTNRNE